MVTDTKKWEPIEIRLDDGRNGNGIPMVVAAAVGDNGLVHIHCSRGGFGTPESLSNLQIKMVVPSKAVPGWQDELVAAIRTGLYPIAEVR